MPVDATPNEIFGLTIAEWAVLLPLIATTVASVYKAFKATKDVKDAGARLEAVVHAVEEAAEQHPEAIKIVKTLAQDKATKLGHKIQAGLDEEAQKATRFYKAIRETPKA